MNGVVGEHSNAVPVCVSTAMTADDRRRNRRELTGRRWAGHHEILTPQVVDSDPGGAWVHSRRVDALEPRGRTYVEAALRVADRIAAHQPPPATDEPTRWRAPWWSRPKRALQLLLAGVSPFRFVRERALVGALPATGAVHGDFHPGNVLYAGGDVVMVIDWEHLNRGPRFEDHLRLVTSLEDRADAAYALEQVLAGARSSDWEHIGAQLRWLSTRLLAEALTADGPVLDDEVARARERFADAHAWADTLVLAGRIE